MDGLFAIYFTPPKQLPGFPKARRVRRKSERKRWVDVDGDILEWDYQHGRIERYNSRGKHKGEFNPDDGIQTKPADPKRTVTPSRSGEMTLDTSERAYCMTWFSKEDGSLVGEENLDGIKPHQIRDMFALKPDDPAMNCYDVTESQIADLGRHVSHDIDLAKYDYSVDCFNPLR